MGEGAARYLEGEVAYTDVLAQNGWRCGLSGKWHLGHSQLPQHGFSHWFTHQFGGGPYNNAPMVRNGELVEEPGYVSTVITDDALALLEANRGRDVLVQVHYMDPHLPFNEPKSYRYMFAGEAQGGLREEFHLSDVKRANVRPPEVRQYIQDRYDNNPNNHQQRPHGRRPGL